MGTGMLVGWVGQRGTGKTQGAIAMAEEACILAERRGNVTRRPVLYTKAVELFLVIRSAYGGDKTEQYAIRPFLECGLLVLDEVQERGGTEWEDRILNYVIDKRYDFQRDTILISNLTTGDFAKNVGASILSRIVEKGRVYTFKLPSFRNPT